MAEFNPYQPPGSSAGESSVPRKLRISPAWSIVFVGNMIAPLLFGWRLTDGNARLGLLLASLVLYGAGNLLVTGAWRYGASLMFGGVLVGLSQFFPVLQIVAGFLGLLVGEKLGASNAVIGEKPIHVANIFSGFIVTFTAGGLLMGIGFCAGEVLRKITPAWWWKEMTDA